MSPFAANNDELAAGLNHGEFNLVSATTSPPLGQDNDEINIRARSVQYNPH